jgi:hypothetical protein
MNVGTVVRVGAGLLGLAAALLFPACGNSKNGSMADPSSGGNGPSINTCHSGEKCSCGAGRVGTVACEGSVGACECEPCPALEVADAPAITPCGGEPFGSWRLTQVEWGRSELSLTSRGESVGSCDMMTKPVGTKPPRLLMSLYEGGDAEYFSERSEVAVSWSESCVTSKVSEFSCGSKAWTGVSACKVDCDTCNCSTSTAAFSEDEGEWGRTQEGLLIPIFGQGGPWAYCVTGDELELSSEVAHLVFERITRFTRPAACSARTAKNCAVGVPTTCWLGACVGGPSCEDASSEGSCLTNSGCSWDADACVGTAAEECQLGDLGVVPGCELTNKSVSCHGTAPQCEGRTADECGGGCTFNDDGRCTGTLRCENFDYCPIEQCEPGPDGDICAKDGPFECSALSATECDSIALDYYGDESCSWEAAFCEGAPVACEDLPNDECDYAAGCALAEDP